MPFLFAVRPQIEFRTAAGDLLDFAYRDLVARVDEHGLASVVLTVLADADGPRPEPGAIGRLTARFGDIEDPIAHDYGTLVITCAHPSGGVDGPVTWSVGLVPLGR
jgi:hypothetical protein